ncbi:MAG: GntR family transcriptional regulator [Bacteroidales bacterium]|nr:GntR family transcriptional regulator [Bacteroidales bacterium]
MNNNPFSADKQSSETVYNQFADYINICILNKVIPVGNQLPSVSKASRDYHISRDSVLAAYRVLINKRIIVSKPGKGYFVNALRSIDTMRVFVLFDAMNQYKETLYKSLLTSLGSKYQIDIAFHYYNPKLFDLLITNAKGKYDYYVLMPHFNVDVSASLDKISPDRLLLLDALPNGYDRLCAAVYQNFASDSYEGLKKIHPKLKKYLGLHIVYNDNFQYMPNDFFIGCMKFSEEFHLPVYIEHNFDVNLIEHSHCYMAISERDLASVLKVIDQNNWKVSVDVGLMSLDDTPMKEVLIGGITTLTTDFEEMGKIAARMIRKREIKKVPNVWRLLDRGSV